MLLLCMELLTASIRGIRRYKINLHSSIHLCLSQIQPLKSWIDFHRLATPVEQVVLKSSITIIADKRDE